MNVILTPKQAKMARLELGLSQSKVASTLDINRAYLSQFENGKYLLSDFELDALKSHLETEGYDFDTAPINSSQSSTTDGDSDIRLIDGFLIPEWHPDDFVEELLFEYQGNIEKITHLCTYDIRKNHTIKPWLDDDYIDGAAHGEKTREVLVLMARNFNIIEELRGHDSCTSTSSFEKANTTGEFVGYSLGNLAK